MESTTVRSSNGITNTFKGGRSNWCLTICPIDWPLYHQSQWGMAHWYCSFHIVVWLFLSIVPLFHPIWAYLKVISITSCMVWLISTWVFAPSSRFFYIPIFPRSHIMVAVFMSLVIVHHTPRSEFMKIEVVGHILLAPTKKIFRKFMVYYFWSTERKKEKGSKR